MRLSPAPVRSRTRGARTGTGPRPVMIARSVSIRSRSTILSLVIVISGIRFKLRNSNPNRRPAVAPPGVGYAREGLAHAPIGSGLHHAHGGHERLRGLPEMFAVRGIMFSYAAPAALLV